MEVSKKDSTSIVSTWKNLTSGLKASNSPIRDVVSLPPAELFVNGTNIRKAVKVSRQDTINLLTRGLVDLLTTVDANKTIVGNDQLIFCVESIIENCPTLTVEEILKVFGGIKRGDYGKLYERLKTPEILDALLKYESEIRPEVLENFNKAKDKETKPQLAIVDYEEYKKRTALEDDKSMKDLKSRLKIELSIKVQYESMPDSEVKESMKDRYEIAIGRISELKERITTKQLNK